MPTYEPKGVVRIGAVPWDGSYRNVRRYRTRDEQFQAISGYCDARVTEDSYTYIRKDSSIRVECNAEWAYRQNYLMYRNENSGTKWYYCFVERVEYVNDNCAEFFISTDVMQTYQFDWVLRPCYVERAHVTDDDPGKHLNVEPDMNFVLGYEEVRLRTPGVLKDDYFDDWVTVVETTAQPLIASSDAAETGGNGLAEATGGWYERMYCGARRFGFRASSVVTTQGGKETAALPEFLRSLAANGGGEAVTDIYMFPMYFEPEFEDVSDPSVADTVYMPFAYKKNYPEVDPLYPSYVAPPTQTFGGYTPRNKKLLTFPYSFFELADSLGNENVWHWEQWERVSTTLAPEEGDPWGSSRIMCKYRWGVPFDSSVTALFIPCRYRGLDLNLRDMCGFNLKAMASWTYSAYSNWMAQEALALKAQRYAADLDRDIGVAKSGMDMAYAAYSIGANAAAAAGNALTGNLGGAVGNVTAMGSGGLDMANALLEDKIARLNRSKTTAEIAGQVSRALRTPPVHKGGESAASQFNSGTMKVKAYRVSLLPEFARMMDDFFDHFGYAIDRVILPYTTGRPCWNYVKTQGCDVRLSASNEDIAKVNAVFDQGVTFWHVDEVGDYTLDNSVGGSWDYGVVDDDEEAPN